MRRLPHLQSLNTELGWDIFHLAMKDNAENLWEVAEPCLYYAYHNRFAEVSKILDCIQATASGKALKVWGRISALAALSGHTNFSELLQKLQELASSDAWNGAASVWTHAQNVAQHQEQCLAGIAAGLRTTEKNASEVAKKMASLFRGDEPIIIVPSDLVGRYFSLIKNGERFSLYGFDEWLNKVSQWNIDEALNVAEIYVDYAKHAQHLIQDNGPLTQLLTKLFHEAEEREEADEGVMLLRVIAIQDVLLSLGVNGVQEWLRDAERP